MENTNTFKVQSTSSNLISLNVTPGHYATSSSHINYYIDMTSLKSRRSEAHAAAKVLAARYAATTIIDTIVCLDGTNVIGAYLADELLNTGILSANLHNTAYIISPEQHSGGQLIFRENYLSMIKGKHVLVLLATATTGKTLQTALECIEYYGGEVVGVSSIFSAAMKFTASRSTPSSVPRISRITKHTLLLTAHSAKPAYQSRESSTATDILPCKC